MKAGGFKVDLVVGDGTRRLYDRLRKRIERAQADRTHSAKVVYTAPYAVYVHEDMERTYRNGKVSKFLESPARSMASMLRHDVADAVRRGIKMDQALLAAAHVLLAASRDIVPYDTGYLHDNSYAKLEV